MNPPILSMAQLLDAPTTVWTIRHLCHQVKMCQLLPVIRLHGTHNRLLPRYISFLTSWLHSRLFISFINAMCIRKVIAFTHLCMHHLNVCMQEGFRGWNLQCNPFCLLHHNLAVKDFVLCCGRTPVACCDNGRYRSILFRRHPTFFITF